MPLCLRAQNESTERIVLDTIATADPRINLVLFSDRTWNYVKDPSIIQEDSLFTENWTREKVNSYQMDLFKMPWKVTLILTDSVSRFTCPYKTKVFSHFGYRKGRSHMGCDLPYPMGTPVAAAFDGKVRIADYRKGYGNVVVIRHDNGLETVYGHLSKINVKADDWVGSGDVIGLGGSTGRSTGPHLHFEARYRGLAFDPEWIIDFENGLLRSDVFMLRRSYMIADSKYEPQDEDEEENIYLTEEQIKAEEERIAKELAAAKYHKIRSGDTLGGLAAKYHTTVNAICRLNSGLTPRTTLRIGRTVRVK